MPRLSGVPLMIITSRDALNRGAFLLPYFLVTDLSMSTIPLTKRGADQLRDELQRLKSVERPSVINSIAEARAQGDLSENAEYDAAKEKQGFVEGRILEVESKLSAAQIIDPSELDT